MALRFNADGSRISFSGNEAGHGLWQFERPPHLRPLAIPAGTPGASDLAWSPDGRWLATIHASGLRLWDAGTARLVSEARASESGFLAAFARDGRSVLTGQGNHFWQWPLSFTNTATHPVVGLPQRLGASNPRALDATIGSRGLGHLFPTDLKYHFQGGGLRLVDTTALDRLYELPGFANSALSLSRTTNWIAQYHPQGIQIRRLAGDPLVIALPQLGGLMLFSPDNRRLLHFGSNRVSAYATATGRLEWVRPCETAATMFPTFSHDGKSLAVGGTSSAQVWLLDPATGEELAILTPQGNSSVVGLAFSPDDQTLAVAHARHIQLWDLRTLRRQLAGLGLDW
jgi:WD40 repeat protein